jgi:hypothetical protein
VAVAAVLQEVLMMAAAQVAVVVLVEVVAGVG